MLSLIAPTLGLGNGPAKPEAPVAPKKKHKGHAGDHLKKALAAHDAGDHQAAKKHALAAVNMLHRAAPAAPASGGAAPMAPSGAPC